jgi:hypothetical protein
LTLAVDGAGAVDGERGGSRGEYGGASSISLHERGSTLPARRLPPRHWSCKNCAIDNNLTRKRQAERAGEEGSVGEKEGTANARGDGRTHRERVVAHAVALCAMGLRRHDRHHLLSPDDCSQLSSVISAQGVLRASMSRLRYVATHMGIYPIGSDT